MARVQNALWQYLLHRNEERNQKLTVFHYRHTVCLGVCLGFGLFSTAIFKRLKHKHCTACFRRFCYVTWCAVKTELKWSRARAARKIAVSCVDFHYAMISFHLYWFATRWESDFMLGPLYRFLCALFHLVFGCHKHSLELNCGRSLPGRVCVALSMVERA